MLCNVVNLMLAVIAYAKCASDNPRTEKTPNDVAFQQMNENDYSKHLDEMDTLLGKLTELTDPIKESIDSRSENRITQISNIQSDIAELSPKNESYKDYEKHKKELDKCMSIHQVYKKSQTERRTELINLEEKADELKKELKKRNTLSNSDFKREYDTIMKETEDLKIKNRNFVDGLKKAKLSNRLEILLEEVKKVEQEARKVEQEARKVEQEARNVEQEAMKKKKATYTKELDELRTVLDNLLGMLQRNEDIMNKIENKLSVLTDSDADNQQYKAYQKQLVDHRVAYLNFTAMKESYTMTIKGLIFKLDPIIKETKNDSTTSNRDVEDKLNALKKDIKVSEEQIRAFVGRMESRIDVKKMMELLSKVEAEKPQKKASPEFIPENARQRGRKETDSQLLSRDEHMSYKNALDANVDSLGRYLGSLEYIKTQSDINLDVIRVKLRNLLSQAPGNKKYTAYETELNEYTDEYESLKTQKAELICGTKELRSRIDMLKSSMGNKTTAYSDDIAKRFNDLKKEIMEHEAKINAFLSSVPRNNTCDKITGLQSKVEAERDPKSKNSFSECSSAIGYSLLYYWLFLL
ncbi:hypothetical protein ENBRE01_1820 [Enteropsectra breve]|nr:hypothetical protein ENBRE01_1820 [Enteropsectra breve]